MSKSWYPAQLLSPEKSANKVTTASNPVANKMFEKRYFSFRLTFCCWNRFNSAKQKWTSLSPVHQGIQVYRGPPNGTFISPFLVYFLPSCALSFYTALAVSVSACKVGMKLGKNAFACLSSWISLKAKLKLGHDELKNNDLQAASVGNCRWFISFICVMLCNCFVLVLSCRD